MIKRLQVCALLCSSIAGAFSTSPLVNDPTALMYKDRPWTFMGQKFIVEPHDKATGFLARIKGSLAFLGGGAIVGYSATQLFNIVAHARDWNRHDSGLEVARAAVTLAACLTGALCSNALMMRWTRMWADREAFLAFVERWPEYRSVTPLSLHESFDNFYRMSLLYNGQETLVKHAQEAIATVRRMVYEECVGQYTQYQYVQNNISMSGSFTHFFVHFDPVRLIEVLLKFFHHTQPPHNYR